MKNKDPLISIIFPMYNGEKFLSKNLNSIIKIKNSDQLELIIIDNNSKDSSVEIVLNFSKLINIKMIRLTSNVGFAKACNIGASKAKGKFIFITNQDVILPSNLFEIMLKIYDQFKIKEEIIISPAIIFENNGIHYFGAKIHFLGFTYTKEMHQELPETQTIKNTQRFSGGSLFIKKSLFLKLGGFDNIFFMYNEDTDLSLKCIRKGIRIYTTNKTFLIHQKHVMELNDLKYYLYERNRFLTFFKNINNFKKLVPYFTIIEIILLIHSILIKKFKYRIIIYYELIKRIRFIKLMREKSRQEFPLLSYQYLSRNLDEILIADLKIATHFKIFLIIINYILNLF